VIVCISLGSVIIFCVIMIALYCSNRSKPFIEGSERKMGQGIVPHFLFLWIISENKCTISTSISITLVKKMFLCLDQVAQG
jgi:hypothetical protein